MTSQAQLCVQCGHNAELQGGAESAKKMQDRLAHCESCVQGIALKLQAMKIQLLDYCESLASQISKTGFRKTF